MNIKVGGVFDLTKHLPTIPQHTMLGNSELSDLECRINPLKIISDNLISRCRDGKTNLVNLEEYNQANPNRTLTEEQVNQSLYDNNNMIFIIKATFEELGLTGSNEYYYVAEITVEYEDIARWRYD